MRRGARPRLTLFLSFRVGWGTRVTTFEKPCYLSVGTATRRTITNLWADTVCIRTRRKTRADIGFGHKTIGKDRRSNIRLVNCYRSFKD